MHFIESCPSTDRSVKNLQLPIYKQYFGDNAFSWQDYEEREDQLILFCLKTNITKLWQLPTPYSKIKEALLISFTCLYLTSCSILISNMFSFHFRKWKWFILASCWFTKNYNSAFIKIHSFKFQNSSKQHFGVRIYKISWRSALT